MAKLMKTPIGRARFAALETPDEYKGNLRYKVDLILPEDDPETQALVEQLEEVRDEYYDTLPAKKRNKLNEHPVAEPELDDDEEPTGNLIFKFKMNATWEDDEGNVVKNKVTRVDSQKNPIPKTTRIFGGSRIRVAFKANPFDGFGLYGVSLRLVAVQVVELAEYSAADVFDEEDEGFTADDESEADDDSDDQADDDDDDGDDDDYF